MSCKLDDKDFLVIDDMPTMCSLIKHILQSLGAKNIDLSYNAIDALRRLSRKAYDMVLCDYNLGPGMNGQQVLEQGKAQDIIKPQTAFLMVTAEKSNGMVLAALEHRPDDYLLKPFSKQGMANAIAKILSHKQDTSEINEAIGRGDIREALLACDAKLAQNPGNSLSYLKMKVSLLLAAKRHHEARQVLEDIIHKKEIPWAIFDLAKALTEEKDYAAAQGLLYRMIEKNPNQVECYDLLSRISLELGDPMMAQQFLVTGTKISPYSVARRKSLALLALENGDKALAAASFKELIRLAKHSAYDVKEDALQFALALSDQNQDQDARDLLRAAHVAPGPESLDRLSIVVINARAAHQSKNLPAATAYMKEAKKLQKAFGDGVEDCCTLRLIKGSLLLKDLDYAKQLAEAMLRKQPDQAEMARQVEALFGELDAGEAFLDIRVLVEGNPAHINQRGMDLFKGKNYWEAVVLFERAVALAPDNPSMALNLAQAMLSCMREGIKGADLKLRIRMLLEKAAELGGEAADDRYRKLVEMFEEMTRPRR